jgi:metal-responsive CopG/Arc/MetJ family transcriptional regulator
MITFHLQSTAMMMQDMTQKRAAGEKITVNARIDREDVEKLDSLANQEGTVHYKRSRSELLAFAVREYVEKHGRTSKSK